jgi:hypothetical protein
MEPFVYLKLQLLFDSFLQFLAVEHSNVYGESSEVATFLLLAPKHNPCLLLFRKGLEKISDDDFETINDNL